MKHNKTNKIKQVGKYIRRGAKSIISAPKVILRRLIKLSKMQMIFMRSLIMLINGSRKHQTNVLNLNLRFFIMKSQGLKISVKKLKICQVQANFDPNNLYLYSTAKIYCLICLSNKIASMNIYYGFFDAISQQIYPVPKLEKISFQIDFFKRYSDSIFCNFVLLVLLCTRLASFKIAFENPYLTFVKSGNYKIALIKYEFFLETFKGKAQFFIYLYKSEPLYIENLSQHSIFIMISQNLFLSISFPLIINYIVRESDSMKERKQYLTIGSFNNIRGSSKHRGTSNTNLFRGPNARQNFGPTKELGEDKTEHDLENKQMPKRYKNIIKPEKRIEDKNQKRKKQRNGQLKIFSRKIFPQKNYFEHQNLFASQDILKIFDWQMEAANSLYLSRETFYRAASMVQKLLINPQQTTLFSINSIQSLAGAIVSLAAKLQTNALNFAQALEVVCNVNKTQLVQKELTILSLLKFKLPIFRFNDQIMEVFHNWHHFILNSQDELKISIDKLELGLSMNVGEWSAYAQQRFMKIMSIYDVVQLNMHNILPISEQQCRFECLTLSMFIWINFETQQFFPVYPDDQTYLTSLFKIFLSEKYEYTPLKNIKWMKSLLLIKRKLNIIQNMYIRFDNSQNSSPKTQASDKTGCSATLDSAYFFRQYYDSILKWN